MSASPSRRPTRIAGQRARPPHQPQQLQTQTQPLTSRTATPEGSATQTLTSSSTPSSGPDQRDGLVLRLRGTPDPSSSDALQAGEPGSGTGPRTQRRRRIQWAEDVIDNEGLGRKKSKVCCIFHKSREVGESSSEDDSSSSGESDGSGSSDDDDDGSARPVGGLGRGKGRRRGHAHEHGDGDKCGHGSGRDDGRRRRPSPNAYERVPRYDVRPLDRQPGT